MCDWRYFWRQKWSEFGDALGGHIDLKLEESMEMVDQKAVNLVVDVDAVDREAFDQQAVDLEEVDLEAVDLKVLDLEVVDLEAVNCEVVNQYVVDRELVAMRSELRWGAETQFVH
jgi:hypothetical protein